MTKTACYNAEDKTLVGTVIEDWDSLTTEQFRHALNDLMWKVNREGRYREFWTLVRLPDGEIEVINFRGDGWVMNDYEDDEQVPDCLEDDEEEETTS